MGRVQTLEHGLIQFKMGTPYWGTVLGLAQAKSKKWDIILVKDEKVVLKRGDYPDLEFLFPLFYVERELKRDSIIWDVPISCHSQPLLTCPIQPEWEDFFWKEYEESPEGDLEEIGGHPISRHGWELKDNKAIREDGYIVDLDPPRECNCGSGEPWASCGANSPYCG
jgi:hypothetical protein